MTESTQTLTVRKADDRGLANHGWLHSRHTFSFASYHDPQHMGFRSLRVINEDQVTPGQGFSTHPHRDMEIFSYVVEGALEHKDSMGNGTKLLPGEIQLMSAGSGVLHSEYNPSDSEKLHFLQIWIEPESRGLEPSYTEWKPAPGTEDQENVVVISPDGRDNSAKIHQDALVYRLKLDAGKAVNHELKEGRGFWLQMIAGEIECAGETLQAGDGASTEAEGDYTFSATSDAHALLFDLG